MRLIIAGTRSFNNYTILETEVTAFIGKFYHADPVSIISGGANGADALGEDYAREKGYDLTIFPANWNEFGAKAGPIRNRHMARFATHCIVFWDGKSKGTKNMIDEAEKHSLVTKIINY